MLCMCNATTSPRNGARLCRRERVWQEVCRGVCRHAIHTCFDLEKSRGELADLKAIAKEANRKVEVMTTCYVVCRPTEQEAKDHVDYYVRDNANLEAEDTVLNGLVASAKTLPNMVQENMRWSIAAGHGSWPLIGMLRQVADGTIRLL